MENFKDIINSDKPTLVDFSASWCNPCKRLKPIIEEIQRGRADSLKVVFADIDDYADEVSEYNIRNVPTLILFKSGAIKWRSAGLHTKSEIERAIDALNG